MTLSMAKGDIFFIADILIIVTKEWESLTPNKEGYGDAVTCSAKPE